jgi:hypothetical protein
MATNIERYLDGPFVLPVTVTHPAAPDSGDPVRFGVFTGVALTDEGDGGNSATQTTVKFGPCVVDMSVKAIDDNGNSAVAVGDIITYTDADTPPLSKKSSGYFFGFAQETVGSGQTGTINVLKPASPGSGTLAAGGVGATQLADNAVLTAKIANDQVTADKLAANAVTTAKILNANVTAAKLSATLQTGFLSVPLATIREIDTNAIPNGAANGGLLASDTTPILNTTNGDTDSALRLAWAASNNDPIIFQTPLPPDLDTASNVTVHFRAAMAGATDTPVINADSYFNEGDTKVEDASAAVTGATYAEYIITIAAADVPAGAQTFTCELTPAAHTTDALYITAIWVEYTRA